MFSSSFYKDWVPNKHEISSFGRTETMYVDVDVQFSKPIQVLAISNDEKRPITFSKSTPEASPVCGLDLIQKSFNLICPEIFCTQKIMVKKVLVKKKCR